MNRLESLLDELIEAAVRRQHERVKQLRKEVLEEAREDTKASA